MKMDMPGKRVILAMHRWTGALAALFLVLLSISGLCLNHAEKLRLHEIRVNAPVLLKRYNMQSAEDAKSLRVDASSFVSVLDGGLYFNARYVTEIGKLLGLYEGAEFLVIVSDTRLVILSGEGELIELLETDQLPFKGLKLLGSSDSGRPVLVADEANWMPDENWLEFQRFTGEYRVSALEWTDLDTGILDAILEHHQGQGPSVYRVLLDLHSGRLFGWGGRTVMDLTAVAILLLVISGVSGWLRKSRRSRNQVD